MEWKTPRTGEVRGSIPLWSTSKRVPLRWPPGPGVRVAHDHAFVASLLCIVDLDREEATSMSQYLDRIFSGLEVVVVVVLG